MRAIGRGCQYVGCQSLVFLLVLVSMQVATAGEAPAKPTASRSRRLLRKMRGLLEGVVEQRLHRVLQRCAVARLEEEAR